METVDARTAASAMNVIFNLNPPEPLGVRIGQA
jgi:hypothetical protein